MNEIKASKEMLIDDLTKNPSVENIAKALCYLLRTSITEEEALSLHHKECDAMHANDCAKCPVRQSRPGTTSPSETKSAKPDLLSKIFSPTFLLFVITIFSLFTAMYCLMGAEGFKTVTRSANSTLQPIYQQGQK